MRYTFIAVAILLTTSAAAQDSYHEAIAKLDKQKKLYEARDSMTYYMARSAAFFQAAKLSTHHENWDAFMDIAEYCQTQEVKWLNIVSDISKEIEALNNKELKK